MESNQFFSVCCFKWGNAYGADYVNILFDNAHKHISKPFDFYCFTDDATGIDEAVKIISLDFLTIDKQRWLRGGWPKLAMFHRESLPPDNPTLLLDLDVVILDSLDVFFERLQQAGGGLHIVRQLMGVVGENLLPLRWRRDRGGNSSVVAFMPREQHHIFDRFMESQDSVYNIVRSEQRFISNHAHNLHYWQEGWVRSFRRQCVPHHLQVKFLGAKPTAPRPPEDCRVVMFHGRPNPHELCDESIGEWGAGSRRGRGPVAWVQENWQRQI